MEIINETNGLSIEYNELDKTSVQVLVYGDNIKGVEVHYYNLMGDEATIKVDGETGEAVITDIIIEYGITVTQSDTGEYVEPLKVFYDVVNVEVIDRKDEISVGQIYEFKLKPIQGHKFESVPILYFYNKQGEEVEQLFTVENNVATTLFDTNLSSDMQGYEELSDVKVVAKAEPSNEVGKTHGTINVYKVSDENLEEFSRVRFIKSEPSMGLEVAPTDSVIDMGLYVNRIKRLHIDVQATTPNVIMCGEYNTKIQAFSPDEEKIVLNFGSVQIPFFNNSSLDFNNKIEIFLPFLGYQDISPSYTGKELVLIYEINVVTGDGVVKIIYNDVPVYLFEVKPSSDIIYRLNNEDIVTIGRNEFNEYLFYGLEPFVYCEWVEGVNITGINSDSKVSLISDLKGYNVITDTNTITDDKMLLSEQEMIYSLLKTGVYIE